MPRQLNTTKASPRYGQRYSTVNRGGTTYHKYGPGRLIKVAPPKVSGAKPVKPPAVRPPVPAVPGPPAPPDPRFDSEIGQLQRTRDETVAGLGAQRTQGLIGYGYNEGAGGALTFDPNNPLSRAAQLKRNYDQSRRRTGNQMAAGGQLYAGAYQSGQDVVNRGQLADEDTLQKSLAEFLARNTSSAGRARTAYETGAMQADSERVGRIEDNPLYEPTVGYPSKVVNKTTKIVVRPPRKHGKKGKR